MKATKIWMVISIAALLIPAAAPAQKNAEVALRAAMETETVKGDLKGAIEQYQKVAQSGNRAAVAQALVRMAECYQKLGDSQSREIYARIVRDYADQKEAAAEARARLGAGASNSGVITRQMWTGPKVDSYGSVSPDGRLLSFVDWDTGDLAVHDFTTGEDRHLTNKGTWQESDDFAGPSAISRDGKRVAYLWQLVDSSFGKSLFSELRLIDLNGGKSSVLTPDAPGLRLSPVDWSPDGKWIAVVVGRGNGAPEAGLVSVADGKLRILKAERGGWMRFSPDGKFLACNYAGPEDLGGQIFLLAVDDSTETQALAAPANDRVLGWTADGHLLFSSDRTGVTGVWALAVKDGKPQGAPELIRANVNPVSLGVTQSGTLYYSLVASGRDIYVAAVDFETGKFISAPSPAAHSYLGLNDFPRWSPDGKYLAYLSTRDARTRSEQLYVLTIRSMETGQVRELTPNLNQLNMGDGISQPLWAPDGGSVLVNGYDKEGHAGVFRIDTQSGNTTGVVLCAVQGERCASAMTSSKDGRTLYLVRRDTKTNVQMLVARDMTSGHETELLRREGPPDYTGLGWAALSPDGSRLAVTAFDRKTQSGAVLVMPSGGGEPREVVRASASGSGQLGGWVEWSPDGRYLIFRKGSPRENYRVPVEGGAAVKYAGEWMTGPSSTSPDGRQVAFGRGEHRIEIWAMENLLPKK